VGNINACLGCLVMGSPLPDREQENGIEVSPDASDGTQDEST